MNEPKPRGVLTIANGSRLYLDMARDLALSLKRHCPHIPRAVLTDARDWADASLFDIVIPWRSDLGKGFFPKLCLDQYTPFKETLYIDADCLVVRNLDFIWDLYREIDLGFVGQRISSGYWYTDIPTLIASLGVNSIPSLNSGMLFLRLGESGSRLLRRAREVFLDDRYVFDNTGGSRPDEMPLAIVFAEQGLDPPDDGGTTMRTPIGIVGEIDIDVLSGRCRFNKRGETVTPAIVHFATWQFHPIYYRERAKLRLANKGPFAQPLARLGAAFIYWRERAAARRKSR